MASIPASFTIRTAMGALLSLVAVGAGAELQHRLVFGSFEHAANAERWAGTVGADLTVATEVLALAGVDGTLYRVVTTPLDDQELEQIRRRARSKGVDAWRLTDPDGAQAGPPTMEEYTSATEAAPHPTGHGDDPNREFDLDVGLQTRSYWDTGLDGQSRFDPSFSASFRYRRYFEDGRTTFTMRPFGRVDGKDDKRTHADMRELYVGHTGDSWELKVGLQQVFWGVTEFHHLVDVLNQTDYVEDIDFEQKLGQPMVNLSLVRDWGVLDFYALTGFRERTFPGNNGRLRFAMPVWENLTEYESGDEEWRLEGAVRWSHLIGPLELGVYHFNGTNRDPDLITRETDTGEWVLQPYYALMNQTGLDAQAIFGEYLLKLEALSRDSLGDRYFAATGGFERTLVGVFGTRADLGLILEYMYDQRGDEATTYFEHDIGLGTRWQLNDVASTNALLGVVWDYQTGEYVVKLEGSRRLGDDWELIVEGRVFGGAKEPPDAPPSAVLDAWLDPDNKLGSFQRDHFLQVELTRFF